MPNLEDAALRHFRRMKRSNGRIARFLNADDSMIDLVTIVLGRTDSTAVTNRDVAYEADRQDILIEKCELVREPVAGDRFVYVQADQDVTAEAKPISDTEPCFTRWYGGAVVRVHCIIRSRR